MDTPILPPRTKELLGPLLSSLPAAAVSTEPPTALLPLLSPILRQRVQLLSTSSSDPWLPLLCYDTASVSKLTTVVSCSRLEPHPVSGEVEIDWDSDVELQFKRLDSETLQCLVHIRELNLSVRLTWCIDDPAGIDGSDQWRIGEVRANDAADVTWGSPTLVAAEQAYTAKSTQPLSSFNRANGTNSLLTPTAEEFKEDGEEGEDEDYWAQYDNTPARSPAPQSKQSNWMGQNDDDYYAQYASVQPAIDNHDPDEAEANGHVQSMLNASELRPYVALEPATYSGHFSTLQGCRYNDNKNESKYDHNYDNSINALMLHNSHTIVHPCPAGDTGSSSSDTVAKLELCATASAASETAIKTHITSSIKSLYRLANVAGMERSEFHRIVQTELDLLGMMDEDE